MTIRPSTDRTDLPPADQEKARIVALDVLVGGYVGRDDLELVCRAFLELATCSDGPSEPSTHDLPPGVARLYEAVKPFVRIVANSSGRIPTERLSFANWNELVRAFNESTAPQDRSNATQQPQETKC